MSSRPRPERCRRCAAAAAGHRGPGRVELRVDGEDPVVWAVAACLACVVLEAIDPDGRYASWSTCDGTLEPLAEGGYRAVWDTTGFGCRVSLRAAAVGALGRVAVAEREVFVVPGVTIPADLVVCAMEQLPPRPQVATTPRPAVAAT